MALAHRAYGAFIANIRFLHHHHDDDGDDDDVQATIDAATRLVDSYNSSTLFQTIRNSRRMERDMAQMRRRVDAACSSLTANICCIIHAPTTSAQTTYYYPDLRS